VQTPKAERIEKLDEHLWTYSEGGFLPHGIEGQADLADEPIALTQADDNPNGATVRFLVDGAPLPDAPENYQRIVLMFDGYDEEALAAARSNWKEVRVRGLDATYWQQNDEGRWEKKA
jgi:DNA polymerase-3 subunit chi